MFLSIVFLFLKNMKMSKSVRGQGGQLFHWLQHDPCLNTHTINFEFELGAWAGVAFANKPRHHHLGSVAEANSLPGSVAEASNRLGRAAHARLSPQS